jgi:hypothetical protein
MKSEVALAAELGLTEEHLERIRKTELFVDEHWVLKSRSVEYTDSGEAAVRVLVGLIEPGDVVARGAVNKAVEDVCVLRVPLKNTRALECRTVRGKDVVVRVRDNGNFVAGSTIAGRWLAPTEFGHVLDFVGRAPRYRGDTHVLKA